MVVVVELRAGQEMARGGRRCRRATPPAASSMRRPRRRNGSGDGHDGGQQSRGLDRTGAEQSEELHLAPPDTDGISPSTTPLSARLPLCLSASALCPS